MRVKCGKLEDIDVSKIEPSPFPLRIEHSREIETLMHTLRLCGQLSPVKVRPHPRIKDRYQLIYGHRRLEAAKRLNWPSVKAEVIPATDEEMLLLALIENMETNSLTDFEKGLALRRLNREFKKTYDEIANLLGRSKAYVAQHIAMTELFDEEDMKDPAVQKILQNLTEGHARLLLRITNKKQRLAAASLIVREKMCIKEASKVIRLFWSEYIPKNEARYSNDAELVEQAVTRLFEDVNQGYTQALLTARASDEFTIIFDFLPFQFYEGEAALHQNLTHITGYDEFKLSHKILKVKVFGNTAYVICYVTKNFALRGERGRTESIATFVLLKRDGQWIIVHEHWSPVSPAMMPYGKAESVQKYSC